MFKKLDRMNIGKKLNFGYAVVIGLMIVSGLVSIIGLGSLYGNFNSYVNGSQAADTAVKDCRININIAARNLREMALNEDVGTYEEYKATVVEKLETVGEDLKVIKDTGLIDEALYEQYATALSDWGNIGYEVIELIEAGDVEKAREEIFSDCVPALNNLVELST